MPSALETVKGLNALLRFIDSGDVANTLGDVQMAAARTAFDAIQRANDKPAQVRECITHLSSAQHAYEQYIRSRSYGPLTMVRSSRDDDANVKRRFVLVVKAICYRYVGEDRLCREALALAKQDVEAVRNEDVAKAEAFGGIAWMFVGAVTGAVFAELGYMAVKNIGHAKDLYGIENEALQDIERALA